MIAEFKKFIMRGNLLDLALGFTVGAAFSTIAKSLVNDIIMPPIGWFIGNSDFADFFWVLAPGDPEAAPYATLAEAQAAGAATINYGLFINNVLAFLVIALVMFGIVRLYNRAEDALEEVMDDPASAEDPDQKKCPYCRSTIPFKATRCGQCTSHLEDATATPTSAATEPPGT